MDNVTAVAHTETFLELTAVIRPGVVDRVVHGLREAGVTRISVSRVEVIADSADPGEIHYSVLEGGSFQGAIQITLVCRAEDGDRLLNLVCDQGRTGRPGGDGVAYLKPVGVVAKVRTGARGEEALR